MSLPIFYTSKVFFYSVRPASLAHLTKHRKSLSAAHTQQVSIYYTNPKVTFRSRALLVVHYAHTLKVPLRLCQRSRHKRTTAQSSRLCGSGENGAFFDVQGTQTQTPCTFYCINSFSAKGTYHARTSCAVGV